MRLRYSHTLAANAGGSQSFDANGGLGGLQHQLDAEGHDRPEWMTPAGGCSEGGRDAPTLIREQGAHIITGVSTLTPPTP